MTEFTETMTRIGDEAKAAVLEMERSDAHGGGFGGRLRLTRELAAKLDEPVNRMSELGVQHSAELIRIDPGILRVIRQVESEGVSRREMEQVANLFDTVRQLAQKVRENIAPFQELADVLQDASAMSKSMRPLANKMWAALQQVMDGQATLDEWERRINEAAGHQGVLRKRWSQSFEQ